MDIIQDVLIYQTQMMRNSSLGPYVPADFSPPEYIVLVNALFYASLGIMILAAFIAMLIKSWVREFDRGLQAISIPEQRAKTREFRYLGMERWKLQEMVAVLPFLIQISLLLFAVGLVLFLFHISTPSFGVTTAIFGVGILYYAITTTISVLVTSSPFHSPLSRTLGRVYQRSHAYFCPGRAGFLSPKMDITPITALGRLLRRNQISFQKSLTYLESDFVEPITATTVDEVQLSTTASALQRIHDSVPDSPYSGLVQQSVWQVAGSPALRMRPLFKIPSWILDRGNGTEYFSRLPPTSVVALKAVFVRMRDARYTKRIAAVPETPMAVNDSWAQLMHALFGLLPQNATYQTPLGARLRRALRLDAFLDAALPDTPSLYALRRRLLRDSLHRDSFETNEEYLVTRDVHRNFPNLHVRFGRLRRALSNHPVFSDVAHEDTHFEELRNALRDALRDAPLRLVHALLHDALLGNVQVDDMTSQGRIMRAFLKPTEPVDLIHILRKNQLDDEQSIWLLNTLSGLHCDGLVLMKHHVSKICLAMLLHQVPKWDRITPPNIMLIEAVVTLVAISSSSNKTYQMKTLTDSHRHPWLLVNLRNPELITKVFENLIRSYRKELTSILFLVIYGLILRGSTPLAVRYLAIITTRANFKFCASALTFIAPALGDDGFRIIGKLLLAPQTNFLSLEAGGSISGTAPDHQDLFNNYEHHLGASQSPAPKSFAILLLLFKSLPAGVQYPLRRRALYLKNPWLRLTAKIIARSDILDEPGLDVISFHDHRVSNMFAALFFQQYPDEDEFSALRRWSSLLVSFLESREFAISSLALHDHVKAVTSSSTLLLQSGSYCHLSGAVHAVFSPILPDDYLPMGWKILDVFADGFERLSVEWRQSFAAAFFTLSRRPMLRGSGQKSGQVTELENILTWDYFCKEEQEPEFTDADFCGLDWMAVAWSLHLSQPSGKVTVSSRRSGRSLSVEKPPENEEFILQVLCRLLDDAPYYSIIPIIPKLREFVGWFDDAPLSEYKDMISARIKGAVHKHQESETFYKFQKFYCMWYL